MLSRLRYTHPARTSIARTILATMLTLVLLSGVAPFASLSSSHECQMACCAGKPSHTAGSCSVAFATDDQEKSAGEPQEEHATHRNLNVESGSSSGTAESSGHDTTKHHSAPHSISRKERSSTLSIASQAMTSPCSLECAAAALAPTQLRRPRDAAAMSIGGRPRPPTQVLPRKTSSEAISLSAEKRRQIRPRAPPIL